MIKAHNKTPETQNMTLNIHMYNDFSNIPQNISQFLNLNTPTLVPK